MAGRYTTFGVLLAFVLASTTFATSRLPFDDEWFSLTLLTEASDEEFWRSLGKDVHPPWVAIFDRWVWSLWPDRLPLVLWRTLSVAAVAWIWLSLLRPTVGRRTWILALALFHPIVFYYAGAQRWYPLLMLAHALRHWAILSAATPGARSAVFSLGAVLGSIAGYLDLLFLLHDGAHYLWRERARLKGTAVPLALSASAVSILILCSPVVDAHIELLSKWAGRGPPALETVMWAGLGPMGEALPHFALLVLAPVVVVVSALGARELIRTGLGRQHILLALSVCLTWGLATRIGVWSPRYSLEVWWLLGIFALAPWSIGAWNAQHRASWTTRVAVLAMGLGLVSTLSGQVFFKSDLNDPPGDFCMQLMMEGPSDAYIVPYHRLNRQVATQCAPGVEVIQPPHNRHASSFEAVIASAEPRVAQGGRLTLLGLTSRSSITRSERAIEAMLDTRCSRLSLRRLWTQPHGWLRTSLLDRPPHRVEATTYDCPPQSGR